MEQKKIGYQKETIITRTGFCPLCEKAGHPKSEQMFVSYSKGEWKVRYSLHNGVPGFTPHIYRAKLFQENVIVYISCGIWECGFINYSFNNNKVYNVILTHTRREIWTIKQWKDLISYNRDQDYMI